MKRPQAYMGHLSYNVPQHQVLNKINLVTYKGLLPSGHILFEISEVP